ncbi:MAG: NUDIX domain-containing protein [Candidatus Dadabacteria bacterium]|nr:NUDIX domain-containing protein [Candidatus Dadabacteria bacterium]NIQ15274.1 NUDIX domain-containing protein [Candidatus Dadabacteria bacterium]
MKKIKNKAGTIAYRNNDSGNIEVLLVSSRKHKDSWVFPVGTVEKNETLEQAAKRECVEESGYIVELENNIDTTTIENPDEINIFTFFSARVIGETDDYEKDRKRIWIDLNLLSDKVAEFLVDTANKFKSMTLVNQS